MSGRLEGKVAIITGAARGQGAAEAHLFASEGAKVLVADVLEEEGHETARAIGEAAAFERLDVSSEADWARAVEVTQDRFGSLTTLVNNVVHCFRVGRHISLHIKVSIPFNR